MKSKNLKWSPYWTLWYICSKCHHSQLATSMTLTHSQHCHALISEIQHEICCAFGRAVILWNCENPGFKHCLLMLWFRVALCLLNFHVYMWKWLRRMECQFHLHSSIQIEGGVRPTWKLKSVSYNFLGYVFPAHKILLLPSLSFCLPFSLPLPQPQWDRMQADTP